MAEIDFRKFQDYLMDKADRESCLDSSPNKGLEFKVEINYEMYLAIFRSYHATQPHFFSTMDHSNADFLIGPYKFTLWVNDKVGDDINVYKLLK